MNRLNFKIISYVFLMFFLVFYSFITSFCFAKSQIELIEEDYENGLITFDQACLYKIYAASPLKIAGEKLPEKYRKGEMPDESESRMARADVRSVWHLLKEETKREIIPFITKPGSKKNKIRTPLGIETFFLSEQPFIYLEIIEINSDNTLHQNESFIDKEESPVLRCNNCKFEINSSVKVLIDHKIKFLGKRYLLPWFLNTLQIDDLSKEIKLNEELECLEGLFLSSVNNKYLTPTYRLIQNIKIKNILGDGSISIEYGKKEIMLKKEQYWESGDSLIQNNNSFNTKIIIINYGYQEVYVDNVKCVFEK